MRTVQASEAKTHFLTILNAVERGETIAITRHGKPIARLIPDIQIDHSRIERAMKEIEALRRQVGRMSIEEIIAAKNEGRK